MCKTLYSRLASVGFAISLAACGGGGSAGGGSDSSLPPPGEALIPIKAEALSLSSYENKILASKAIGPFSLHENFGHIETESKINWLKRLSSQFVYSNSWGFADFFSDGSYSFIGHSFEYDFTSATENNFGRVYFFKFLGGKWVDKTSDLLDDNVGCLHSRKAIISDFNADGKPDVFFSCTGTDTPPFPGEKSLLVVSTESGKYRKEFIIPGEYSYAHGASAADINGDGYPEIVLADSGAFSAERKGVGIFLNNRDDTFTYRTDLMPGISLARTAYSAEFIKFDGRDVYDLFLSAHEGGDSPEYNQPTQIVENDGSGVFRNVKLIPRVTGYGYALDIIYEGGFLYLLRTVDTQEGFYQRDAIQKIDYPSLTSSTVIYTHSGEYKNGSRWINWIGFHGSDIIALDADYGLRIPR